MIGQKFNRLTVTHASGDKWLCKCECGNSSIVRKSHLTSGSVKSCGCIKAEHPGAPRKYHFDHLQLGQHDDYPRDKENRCASVADAAYRFGKQQIPLRRFIVKTIDRDTIRCMRLV